MIDSLLVSLSIIFFGLMAGYIIQKLVERRIIQLPISLETLRKLLQKIGLLFFVPISFIGALWIVQLKNAKLAALPLLGVFALLIGGALGFIAAKLLRLGRKETGSMLTCASFSNIGSIGGLVCYIFFGEKGYALVPVYKLFEQLIYFAIGLPIAKIFSTNTIIKEKLLSRLRQVATDIFVIVALASVAIGILLNLSGIKRPVFYETVNTISIPAGTIALLASIGLAMKFGKVKKYLKECLTVCIIKFMLVPITISASAFFLGYGKISEGLPLKVVIILSCMPVAFSALIPISIYDLDLDLANSCWLITTFGLIIILPILYYIVNLF